MRLDEIKYAFENLKHRRLRSFLSVLSILIGIAAIFALVSFGIGIQNYVNELAKESGGDKLFIQAKGVGAPGTDDTFYLGQDDVDFVERINGVAEIDGLYAKPIEIISREQKKYNYFMGGDMKKMDFIEETMALKLDSGRRVKDGEIDTVALGYNYKLPEKIFTKPLKLGDKVQINGETYEIAGFYESIGNPQDDGNIYTSKEGFERIFPDSKDKYGFIIVRAEQDIVVKDLAERITERLRNHKDQEEGKEDFFVQTFEDAIQQFQIIINVINGILFLIALISVIVAGVNIMNTMYTAVIERTNEIGIMKAVGAKNSDILFIFIFEAGLLGTIGGVLGVIIGYIIASIGGNIAAASGFGLLQPVFPIYLVISCILFAFFVGAGAGIMPAWGASKLRPVEALRYE